ncbi:rCG26668, partial [Rattus norvegicus]
MPGKMVS